MVGRLGLGERFSAYEPDGDGVAFHQVSNRLRCPWTEFTGAQTIRQHCSDFLFCKTERDEQPVIVRMNIRHDRYFVFNLEPLTWDARVWRYMIFEKFCWLIETSQLWHTRLDKFKDAFEGSVTEKYIEYREAEQFKVPRVETQYEPWCNKAYRFTCYACCWHASPHESDTQWQLYAAGGAGIAIVSSLRRLQSAVEITPYLMAC